MWISDVDETKRSLVFEDKTMVRMWTRAQGAVHADPVPAVGPIVETAVPAAPRGFYSGFDPIVAGTGKAVALLIACALLLTPEGSAHALEAVRKMSIAAFGGWYIALFVAFVLFCLLIAVLPVSGRIVMGPPGAKPVHRRAAWLSMMVCAGIGVGILVFAVGEPVSHFITNPEIVSGQIAPFTRDAAVTALEYTFLHWGVSAWSCYAVIAVGLGLACHVRGLPMTMRSLLVPLFGRRLDGWSGHAIDILALLTIMAGIVTTIVFGIAQICTGLADLTGLDVFADRDGAASLTALLTALVAAIAVTVASTVSGLHRGVRWVSKAGMALVFIVLVAFLAGGGGTDALWLFGDAMQGYVARLPARISTLFQTAGPTDVQINRLWQGHWTAFYWAWWIAFAPFVGMFLATISYGRSLREFIVGAVLVPSLICCIWFGGTGGSALVLELNGVAQSQIVDAARSSRILATVEVMFGPTGAVVMKTVLLCTLFLLVVASSTAAITAIKSIGAGGRPQEETTSHSMLWALVIAALCAAVMTLGGADAIRDLMIVAAFPFSIIMALAIPSILLMVVASIRRCAEVAQEADAAAGMKGHWGHARAVASKG